ncbi:F0F1 ATP synthase subunit epsilon [Seohaeicola saemankumensis]|uniref:ATP synthase epsilon chain n=1 Tax=Seohaeicola saemankumensis TaxID=481181 RepID=A0ABW3TEL3_9RHOB
MRLRIVTPLSVIVDSQIDSLRAEDASGSFGVLSGHAPFLTALAVSIVSWRQADAERFCAVRGGVMTVSHADDHATMVDIATREAVAGDDLAILDRQVLARFQSDEDQERMDHVETVRLQLNAIRRMISRLKPGANAGEFQ